MCVACLTVVDCEKGRERLYKYTAQHARDNVEAYLTSGKRLEDFIHDIMNACYAAGLRATWNDSQDNVPPAVDAAQFERLKRALAAAELEVQRAKELLASL